MFAAVPHLGETPSFAYFMSTSLIWLGCSEKCHSPPTIAYMSDGRLEGLPSLSFQANLEIKEDLLSWDQRPEICFLMPWSRCACHPHGRFHCHGICFVGSIPLSILEAILWTKNSATPCSWLDLFWDVAVKIQILCAIKALIKFHFHLLPSRKIWWLSLCTPSMQRTVSKKP